MSYIIAGTILIELSESQKETRSGILLPDSLVVERNRGTVLMTGKAKNSKMPQEVKTGDTVVFNHKSYRNKPFVLDDKDVILVSQEDVLLINKN